MTDGESLFAALLAAVEADDQAMVVKVLAGQPEDERRGAAKLFWIGFDDRSQYATSASVLAALGVGSIEELKRHKIARQRRRPFRSSAEVLADRRPPWLAEWVAECLKRSGRGHPRTFPLAWMLVRGGLIERPTSDAYVLEMLWSWREIAAVVAPGERLSGADLLRRTPELLEWELWRLFEVEGRPRVASLTSDGHWLLHALPTLAASGEVDRGRLIDAALRALSAGFSAYNNRWFVELLERLELDAVDARAHRGALIGALAGGDGPTVSLVAFVLGAEAPELPLADVSDAVAAAVPRLPRSSALAALGLLAEVASSAANGDAVLPAITAALTHSSKEVQAAALGVAESLLPRVSPADLRGALDPAASLVAPSLARRLAALVDLDSTPTDPASRLDASLDSVDILRAAAEVGRSLPVDLLRAAGAEEALRAARSGAMPSPWSGSVFELPPPRPDPVAPLDGPHELGRMLLRVIEDGDDPIEVELAIDALGRYGRDGGWDLGPSERPLIKRLRQLRTSRTAHGLRSCSPVAAFRHALFDRLCSEDGPSPRRFRDGTLLIARIRQATMSPVGPALAFPTHRQGWIDPRVLAVRLEEMVAAGEEPGSADLVQALLRVGPWHREEALARLRVQAAEVQEAEPVRALRWLCGDADARIGPTTTVWIAAADARAPLRGDAAVAGLLDKRTRSLAEPVRLELAVAEIPASMGSYRDVTAVTFRSTLPPGLPHSQVPSSAALLPGWEYAGHEVAAVRAASMFWPAAPEVHAAHGVEVLSRLQHGDLGGLDAWLEPYIDADLSFGEMGVTLLLVAMASKSLSLRTAAADLLVTAVDDGRLVGTEVGDLLRRLAPTGSLALPRLAVALAEAAQTSLTHARIVRVALERGLSLAPGTNPRGVGDLAEVLHELVVATNGLIGGPEFDAWLSSQSGSGKAAKAARAIRALEVANDAGEVGAAIAAARTARAARWSGT